MSSKNNALATQHSASTLQPSIFNPLRPRSLRLRLILWYGLLIAIALSLFALLVLSLTMNALSQSVDSTVRAEARAASIEVKSELVATPPYWPAHLSLNTLNTYRNPGIVIEVIDGQGIMRYDSDNNPGTHIPKGPYTTQATLAGRTDEYNGRFDGEPVRVEAVPITAPGTASTTGSVIGTLLVARSLSDINTTLTLLRTLLLLTGGITLLGTLLGGWLIATRVLHPLSEMAQTARTIAATTAQGTRIGSLSQRVKRSSNHDEMAQVVDALNDMLSDLQKAVQGQRRFITDASHELRAPLTTIQGNLAFLQRHGDELPPQERKTMLSDAYGETLRLSRLVEDLLLLARADANAESLHPLQEQGQGQAIEQKRSQLVELDRVVLQLVRQLRGRLQAEEATPRIEIGSIEPVRVQSDEETLRRILLILLDNALKYTPASVEPNKGRVSISVERHEREAVIQVRDTGIGIEPDALEHIFERFYRADRARSRQGAGLGLAIAQTLAEQLGGRITAESVAGEGSTFNVYLPLNQSSNP